MSGVPSTLPAPPDPKENPPEDPRPFFGGRTYQWYKEAAWFAEQMFRSGVLNRDIDSKEKAFAILCKGDELGLPPFAAWSYIYLTKQNRLAIQSKGALAVVQSKPLFESYHERLEHEGTPQVKAIAVAKRKGHDAVLKEFGLEDAEKAGLLKQKRARDGSEYDGPWQAYVKDMLLARARARALDIAFAAELGGIPIEGVAEDIDAMDDKRGHAPAPAAGPARAVARPALPPPSRDSLLDELSAPSQQPQAVAVHPSASSVGGVSAADPSVGGHPSQPSDSQEKE